MLTLPLYDSLAAKANGLTVTEELLSNLTTTLNSLTVRQGEQVSLLMIHHLRLTSNPFSRSTKRDKMPLEIKISQGGGFSYDLHSLPEQLQLILALYCGV